MTNNKQQRADIIEDIVERRYKSELMYHIQQHVINAFMEVDEDDEFYINNEGHVHITFNTNIFLGQQVVEDYMKSNDPGIRCGGLSITSVNEVLYEYKELVCEMDLDTEDNIGSMVNCIMFDIANNISHALEFE